MMNGTYLNINVVAPSSEKRTAGGEQRSFAPHNSALNEFNESTSIDRTNKLFDGGPNLKLPPTHCLPSNRPVVNHHQILSLTTYKICCLKMDLPVSTKRYTCNSTRCPGAGRNKYLQIVGP